MNSILLFILFAVIIKESNAEDNYDTVEAISGETAEIPCVMTPTVPGDTLNLVAWYRNDSKLGTPAIYSRDFRPRASRQQSPAGGRYRMVEGAADGRLLVGGVTSHDAGLYYCLADFAASPAHKTYVYLSVIEPPERMWVIYENGTRVATAVPGQPVSKTLGPFRVGDTVRLYCVTFGGKPRPSVAWWRGGSVWKESSTPLSDRRVRTDLVLGPLRTSDHGLLLTCRANNTHLAKHIFVDITLDMYLPAELVSVQAVGVAGPVRAGDVVRLQCRVLGARPPPQLIWTIDDNQIHNMEQNVTKERSQRLVVSSARVLVEREHDGARLTCCARDLTTLLCARPLRLTVLHPPMLQVMVEGEVDNGTLKVVKGSDVTLNCSVSANPWIYDFTWYHEEEIISRNTSEGSLRLESVSEQDGGEYVCAGANQEGATTSDPLLLDVLYPPYCNNNTVLEFGLSESESVNLTCGTSSNPGPLEYRWMQAEGVHNATTFNRTRACVVLNHTDNMLEYTRPPQHYFVFCWSVNGVEESAGPTPWAPCTFVISPETVPRAPAGCVATRRGARDIAVRCTAGHDGGLPQKFILTVTSLESNSDIVSITSVEPSFVIEAPARTPYRLVVGAFNDKGPSDSLTIRQEDIGEEKAGPQSAVPDIGRVSLALCGGVLLVLLAACGLVLCAHDREHSHSADRESKCGMFEESDEDSECNNLRRSDSFRRALASGTARHGTHRTHRADLVPCRPYRRPCLVHSLQNLVEHAPLDLDTQPKQSTTFYTLPRKIRQKTREANEREEGSVLSQSDGFSLPPPPDEFSSYRAASRMGPDRLRALPMEAERDEDRGNPFAEMAMSPVDIINAVGVPTAEHHSLYADPDNHTLYVRPRVTLSTFQNNFSSLKESGF